jgi:hypothetical protein
MSTSIEEIESFRADHDSAIMSIPGVVSIATGQDSDGSPCLIIGTSVSTDKVRSLLPQEIAEIKVRLEFIGEIRAQ